MDKLKEVEKLCNMFGKQLNNEEKTKVFYKIFEADDCKYNERKSKL